MTIKSVSIEKIKDDTIFKKIFLENKGPEDLSLMDVAFVKTYGIEERGKQFIKIIENDKLEDDSQTDNESIKEQNHHVLMYDTTKSVYFTDKDNYEKYKDFLLHGITIQINNEFYKIFIMDDGK